MITQEEVARSIHGAIRLATFDRRGFEFFDDSDERFWLSFWAAAFVAPFHLFFTLLGVPSEGPKSFLHFFVVVALLYAIRWTLWPLVMVSVTRGAGRFDRYNRYMMAYNWAQFVGAVFLVSMIFLANLLFPPGLVPYVFYAGVAAVLAYEWFIARNALEISKLQATLIIALNLALAFGLQFIAEAMTRN